MVKQWEVENTDDAETIDMGTDVAGGGRAKEGTYKVGEEVWNRICDQNGTAEMTESIYWTTIDLGTARGGAGEAEIMSKCERGCVIGPTLVARTGCYLFLAPPFCLTISGDCVTSADDLSRLRIGSVCLIAFYVVVRASPSTSFSFRPGLSGRDWFGGRKRTRSTERAEEFNKNRCSLEEGRKEKKRKPRTSELGTSNTLKGPRRVTRTWRTPLTMR